MNHGACQCLAIILWNFPFNFVCNLRSHITLETLLHFNLLAMISMNHIFLDITIMMNDWSQITEMSTFMYLLTIKLYYLFILTHHFAKLSFYLFYFRSTDSIFLDCKVSLYLSNLELMPSLISSTNTTLLGDNMHYRTSS